MFVALHCFQIKAQLHVSSSDYESLQQRCFECRATLNLLEHLIQASDGFRNIEKLTQSKCYLEATEILASVSFVLQKIHGDYGDSLVVFPHLMSKHSMLQQRLNTCVLGRWTELVSWKASPVVMTIASGADAHTELEGLAQALHNLGALSEVVAKFAAQFMTQLIDKLLSDSNSPCNLDISEGDFSVSFKVVASVSGTDMAVQRSLRQLQTFAALMDKLFRNLLDITVVDNISTKQKNGVNADGVGTLKPPMLSVMSMFRDECASECLERLIAHCVSPAVPTQRSEMALFAQVATAVTELQCHLVEIGLMLADNNTLVDYVSNVDVMFADKRCIELLNAARRIIMTDIHNVVPVIIVMMMMMVTP